MIVLEDVTDVTGLHGWKGKFSPEKEFIIWQYVTIYSATYILIF